MLSTSSPRMISIASKLSRSIGPPEFFTPGTKWIGIGQTSGKLTFRTAAARSSVPAGTTQCGISTSPTLEVIMPLAMTASTSS